MKRVILKIHPADNVIVALQNLKKNETVIFNNKSFYIQEDISAKHKFFEHEMQEGDKIIMYGVTVGKVQQHVYSGSLMTTANVKHAADDFEYRPYNYYWQAPDVSTFSGRTFMGYHRNDGRVGSANYWLFIPTVFCENRNLDVIREALHTQLGYTVTDKYKQKTQLLVDLYENDSDVASADLHIKQSTINTKRLFNNVDGIKFLNHQGGCGGTREDASILSKLLAAYADHPNVSGITILSLGCQNLQTQQLLNDIQKANANFDKPLLVFEQQQSISEEDLITDAIKKTFLGLIEINKLERKPATLDKLCIGVKCGGSDGFSGISANPAVGYCSDLITALGGKILLAEFPELCGAEQGLIDRTLDEAAAKKSIHLMKTYNQAAHKVGSVLK